MREIDPSHFHPYNVTDTCAVWHVLSSHLLYATARSSGCFFILTDVVYHECFVKKHKKATSGETELQKRLQQQIQQGGFTRHSLDIDDLQDVDLLAMRKTLGKGELSCIAYAKKIQQAFLTDDKGARTLAEQVIEPSKVQTTPHLFGWLFFTGRLGDSDKQRIINEHNEMKRASNDRNSLERYFEVMYKRAMECRLMSHFGEERD